MKIIVYNNDGISVAVAAILKERQIEFRHVGGTHRRFYNEIFHGGDEPDAVLIPYEMQDCTAVEFLFWIKRQNSGIKPLFFVYGIRIPEIVTGIYRMDNVYVISKFENARIIADTITFYSLIERCDNSINTAENFLSRKYAKKFVVRMLKTWCFDQKSAGFEQIADSIIMIGESAYNIFGRISESCGMSRDLVYHNMKNSVDSAWKRAVRTGIYSPIVCSGSHPPSTKDALILLRDAIEKIKLREVAKSVPFSLDLSEN